jgi:hypothetical protein
LKRPVATELRFISQSHWDRNKILTFSSPAFLVSLSPTEMGIYAPGRAAVYPWRGTSVLYLWCLVLMDKRCGQRMLAGSKQRGKSIPPAKRSWASHHPGGEN